MYACTYAFMCIYMFIHMYALFNASVRARMRVPACSSLSALNSLQLVSKFGEYNLPLMVSTHIRVQNESLPTFKRELYVIKCAQEFLSA